MKTHLTLAGGTEAWGAGAATFWLYWYMNGLDWLSCGCRTGCCAGGGIGRFARWRICCNAMFMLDWAGAGGAGATGAGGGAAADWVSELKIDTRLALLAKLAAIWGLLIKLWRKAAAGLFAWEGWLEGLVGMENAEDGVRLDCCPKAPATEEETWGMESSWLPLELDLVP